MCRIVVRQGFPGSDDIVNGVNGSILEVKNLVKYYRMGSDSLEVLKGVDLVVEEGRIIAIVGESGAGKSTLLHIIGMLDRPTSGSIRLRGMDLTAVSDTELAVYRNRFIGFVFQFHHLLPEFTALENVAMPALIAGRTLEEAEDRALHLLERVGLAARISHRPAELSGGELQRVAVARALMNQPTLILADEPSGNLDHRNSEMLHDLMWDLAREHGSAFVVVTHDTALARRADEVLLLQDGILGPVGKETIGD